MNAAVQWTDEMERSIFADTIEKRWCDSHTPDCSVHPAIYRALGITPDRTSFYAVGMCRIMDFDGRKLVGVAWPCPQYLAASETPEFEWPWLGISQIIAWDPVADKAWLAEDPSFPMLAGGFQDETWSVGGNVYGSPSAWLKAWCWNRARWLEDRIEAKAQRWQREGGERDLCPGALVIGDPAQIRWPVTDLPRDITCIGIDHKAVSRAIFKSAGLPFVRSEKRKKR